MSRNRDAVSSIFPAGNNVISVCNVCARVRYFVLLLMLICFAKVAAAADMEITPFNTFNQSPLVQIYGLPHDTGANIVLPGKFSITLNQDLSSNYTATSTSREQILLDGETYRIAFAARYGIAPRWEVGVEMPYLVQGGGFLDAFVIDWHNTFGLPQGGRDSAPKDRLLYSYRKDGIQKLLMDRSGSGIGDISLTSGVSLYNVRDIDSHDQLALKAAVKLPTGDSSFLRGSGGADVMLQLCGSSIRYSEWGSLGVYGSAGALLMSKGDVLRNQHKTFAGVGSLGIGWGPASWISFKVQLNGNTALYSGSSLDELSRNPLLLVIGGALKFPGEYLLDIGVAEDVAVATAPDVSFHLGLSKRF
ncbi:MAG: DUF3187 family protein [Desulfuromonadaceae bacterium]|nr:DUF3187 family protein [Desulfuromonadaceae bacterium]